MYYRRNGETLEQASDVYAPGYTLAAENGGEHTYPVDGWFWFATLDDAMASPSMRTAITHVTMRQARLALMQAGLLDDIAAAVEALPEPKRSAAKIEWEYSQEVQRGYGLVTALTLTLGLSDTQIDQLFALAATL